MRLPSEKMKLIEKYQRLVKQEEERLRKLTIKTYRYMKNAGGHPTDIAFRKTPKAKERDYEYLRQKYYRLKKKTKENVYEKAYAMRFEDYWEGVRSINNRLDRGRSSGYRELYHAVQQMSNQQKQTFIKRKYDTPLSDVYLMILNDIKNNTRLFYDNFLEKITLTNSYNPFDI